MKALIISDANDIINEFTEYYKSQNYDVIVYRWLMKALDNIEEIDPDLIFVNATEYPRHWKILSQYVKGIDKNPKIVLFSSLPLSNEDREKAECLQIDSIVNSTEDLEEVCTITDICQDSEANSPETENIIEQEQTDSKINQEDEQIEKVLEQPTLPEIKTEIKVCKFLFSNPVNLVLITGKVESFNDSKLIFLPDNPEDTANIAVDTIIKKCTLKVDNQINTVDVKVIKNDTEIEFLICN
jgi:DNA-binding response OmpR family regulator